jgi:hypothetical protein
MLDPDSVERRLTALESRLARVERMFDDELADTEPKFEPEDDSDYESETPDLAELITTLNAGFASLVARLEAVERALTEARR